MDIYMATEEAYKRGLEDGKRIAKETNGFTNADRIRAMTDEELSMIMVQLTELDDRIHYCQNLPECEALLDTEDGISAKMCARCMLAWLKQPAEVDNG